MSPKISGKPIISKKFKGNKISLLKAKKKEHNRQSRKAVYNSKQPIKAGKQLIRGNNR
jgi:hypothetical protein